MTPRPEFWQTLADLLDPPEHPYLHNPVGWVEDTLGEFLWSKQKRILESVRDNRVTCVPSCHDSGKSFIAARAAAWWISVHPPGTAKVISTAPTGDQVSGILWQEIQTCHTKGKLPGRCAKTVWYVTPDGEHYTHPRPGEYRAGFGRKPADNNPVGFSGIHAQHVLFILDEADGMTDVMWGATRTALTNDGFHGARLLAIGNPDNPGSTFAERVRSSTADPEAEEYVSDQGAHVIRINGLKTPNFTDEHVPEVLRRVLLSPTWVQETKDLFGEDSAYYTSKVLGRHPKDASDGVIPYSWVKGCMMPRKWGTDEPVELGIDVGASENGDQTVVRERRGPVLGRVWRYREADHTKLAPTILGLIQETGATSVKVDAGGVGHGLTNTLTDYGDKGRHRAQVHGVLFGSAARDRAKFINVRAEMHWTFRELVQQGAVDLSTLTTERDETGKDVGEQVVQELVAPRYDEDTSGRIRVETKDAIRGRLRRSPDDADAVLLAWYQPESAGGFDDMEVEVW